MPDRARMEAISCMRKQLQEDALRMAESLVDRLPDHAAQKLEPLFAETLQAVGPLEGDWLLDRHNFLQELEELAEAYELRGVGKRDVHACALDEDACVTVSRFAAITREGMIPCRLTLIWQELKGELKICHAHFSVAVTEEHGGAVAHALRESIVLRDADGISHFLSLSDIVYIEASRQSTLVHAVTGTFRMSEGITHLLTRLDGKFVRIHRGFAVNVDHVAGMRPGYVMLDEGTSLPVPSRRTREVADDLRRAIGS